MMKRIYDFTATIAFSLCCLLVLAACTEYDQTVSKADDGDMVPITIRATKGNTTRVGYAEVGGDSIAATWEASDQLIVVTDGRKMRLDLASGAGTDTATFKGLIPRVTPPTICLTSMSPRTTSA